MSLPGLAQAPDATTNQNQAPDQTQGPPPPPHPGGRGMMMNPEHRAMMLQKQLGLSADQTAQIKSILEASQSKMMAMRQDQSAAPADRRSQMMALRQSENQQIEAVLTPDQKTKYEAMEARRREEMRDRRPPMGAPENGEAPPPPPSSQPQ